MHTHARTAPTVASVPSVRIVLRRAAVGLIAATLTVALSTAAVAVGISTDPPWTTSGFQDGSLTGTCVSTAGDVNGDGFSDFLVTAPAFDSTFTDEGRVYLYLGTPTGPAAGPSWMGSNGIVYSQFGISAAPAGDVNGDGYADVVIGAYRPGTPPVVYPGRVYVFYGSPTGLPKNPSWFYVSPQGGDYLGYSVCSPGDVNGDGYDDILVGSPQYDSAIVRSGRVSLFLGSAIGIAATPSWTYDGELTDSEFGFSVAAAGDVNADGYADFVVGAPGYEVSLVPGGGKAYLFTGGPSGPVRNAWSTVGGITGARHGHSVATAGDINGDGYADVVVGAPQYHPAGVLSMGRAVVYPGSSTGLSVTPLLTVLGTVVDERLGSSVAPAGDLDGDGYADIAIGSPGYSTATARAAGRVQVFLGNNAALDDLPAWSQDGTEVGAEFGNSVCAAGDANGDGFGDLLIGEWKRDLREPDRGRAYLYWGAPQTLAEEPMLTLVGEEHEMLGISADAAGDLNGDGYSDFIVGSPSWDGELGADVGRVRVHLGSEAGPSATPDLVLTGSQAGEIFGYSVAGAGDVNGDGYSDVIIGALQNGITPTPPGKAYVYLGSATDGLQPVPWVASAGSPGGDFGWWVTSAGDLNRDGYGDVAIGAPRHSAGPDTTGAVFCFYGSPTGLGDTPTVLLGTQNHALFGYNLASLDINGDGYTDLAVGSPYYSEAGVENEGRIDVFYGSPTGIRTVPTQTFIFGFEKSQLGFAVANGGTPANNPCESMLAGSPTYTGTYMSEGRLDLLDAGPCPDILGSVGYRSFQAGANMGYSAGSAGDVNGDGASDVLVPDPFYDYSSPNEGALWLYPSRHDGTLPNIWDWRKYGGVLNGNLGFVATGLGDVNGDGFGDIIACMPYLGVGGQINNGQVLIYGGGARVNPDHNKIFRPQLRRIGGGPLARLDLSDATDRVRLDLRGRSAGGRTRVRLEWNVAPYGTVPAGTPQRGYWQQTGPAGVHGSYLDMFTHATGLAHSTDYALRFRAASRLPYFPFTRWFTPPLTAWAQKQFRTPAAVIAAEPGPGVGGPTGPRVTGVYPNPVRGSTSIAYALSEPGHVRLRIFDTRGRLVTTLVDRPLEAGAHSVTWDGIDARGARVPVGVYHVALECQGTSDTRKLLVLH